MKVNANKVEHMRYKALLNGEELSNCFEADDKKGYAKCLKTDKDGKFITTGDAWHGGCEFVEETLYGDVEIIDLQRAS